MKYFVGLDVALRSLALCIIDSEGQIVLEQALLCEVDEIRSCLEEFGHPIVRIGFEAGTMSQTLFHGLKAAGYDVVCMEARQVYAALSAMRNKTDKNDARGIAQVLRSGWYNKVHIKSHDAHYDRSLLTARKTVLRKCLDLEAEIRGLFKVFGIRLPSHVKRNRWDEVARPIIEADERLSFALKPMLDATKKPYTLKCLSKIKLVKGEGSIGRELKIEELEMVSGGAPSGCWSDDTGAVCHTHDTSYGTLGGTETWLGSELQQLLDGAVDPATPPDDDGSDNTCLEPVMPNAQGLSDMHNVVFNDLIQAAASHGDVSVQVTDANGQTQTVTIGEVVGALLGANVTIETANLNNGSLGGLTTFSGTDSALVQINTNNTGLSDTLENLLHEGLHVLSNIGDGPDDGPAGNEAAWVATAAQELRNAVLQATAATETKDDDFDTTPQDGCET